MESQNIIDQFFIEDGQLTDDQSKIRKSVLLSLVSDIQFTILLPGKWRNMSLSPEQNGILREMLPSFTVISLFCSAVDVLARVVNKRIPPSGQNGDYFRNCAIDWFRMNDDESHQLWQLRNGISHSYRLHTGQVAKQYGYGGIVRQSTTSGLWHFYLHAMYSSLVKAKRDIYEQLTAETDDEKQITADYLNENGFYYTIA